MVKFGFSSCKISQNHKPDFRFGSATVLNLEPDLQFRFTRFGPDSKVSEPRTKLKKNQIYSSA